MKPVVNALLLADYVHIDVGTGKCTILGTFTQIHMKEFPGIHAGACIYVNLSDFTGTHKFTMRFVRDSDGQQLAQSTPAEITQKDRLHNHEIALRLPPLGFETPGTYSIQILWDGGWIGELKVHALEGEETQ